MINQEHQQQTDHTTQAQTPEQQTPQAENSTNTAQDNQPTMAHPSSQPKQSTNTPKQHTPPTPQVPHDPNKKWKLNRLLAGRREVRV